MAGDLNKEDRAYLFDVIGRLKRDEEKLTQEWRILYVALQEIEGMEGEPEMTDADFVKEALRIASEARARVHSPS